MNIALIAHNSHPITSISNAIEDKLMLAIIDSLQANGANVVLFAQAGSQANCKVQTFNIDSIDWQYENNKDVQERKQVEENHAYFEVFQILKNSEVDLVHNFSTHQLPIFTAQFLTIPTLSLLYQKPLAQLQSAVKLNQRENSFFITPNYHLKTIWAPHSKINDIIYTGIDHKTWKFRNSYEEKRFMFWGEIERSSDLENIIQTCKNNNYKLWIIGKVTNAAYFEYIIKPALNDNIKYLGELEDTATAKFLGEANAAIFSTTQPNTVSKILRSLSCGTPVATYNNDEIMEYLPSSCGNFITNEENSLENALEDVMLKSRKDCRNFIEANFTLQKTTHEYLSLYQKIISQYSRKLNFA